MRCKVVRHHLLASEKPARPPGAVADHLARCLDCQAWQRQLVRVERLVPHLYVPPSSGKVDCVREVLHGEAYNHNGKAEVEWQRKERALRKVAVTFAMAAGLLFFALCWYAWQYQRFANGPELAERTEIERIVRPYDRGALTATVPRERIERLAAVAGRLQDQMRQRAQAGKVNDLTTLAHQYDVLVREGILVHAREVSIEERTKVLGVVAEQLSRAESEASRLAVQHPPAHTPLDRIAVASHNGHLELRKLIDAKT